MFFPGLVTELTNPERTGYFTEEKTIGISSKFSWASFVAEDPIVKISFGLIALIESIIDKFYNNTTANDKTYNFNDKDIHEMYAKKVKVKKGHEYIKFDIQTLWKRKLIGL